MDVVRFLFLGAALVACAPSSPPQSVPRATFPGTDGRDHVLVDPNSALTVIEFFSAHCPCQEKHDERLRELAKIYSARGVAFVAVDSESGASLRRDREEAEKRSYPILIDARGAVAKALAAEYATFTVIVDRGGNIVFRGGIDSDRSHLTHDAVPYLRDAIDDTLAGKPLRHANAKTLGCALQLE